MLETCSPCLSPWAAAPCVVPACLQGMKPDMTAAKIIRDGLGAEARAGVYGHIPGVQVGDEFDGRGELCVLGLHIQVR